MTRTIHRTYDSWKTASPDDEWQSDDDRPERDPDAEYDAWRDKEINRAVEELKEASRLRLTRQQLDQIFDILRDIEATLDEKADVDDGIPNQAMRMLVGVRDVIRKLEGR